MIRIIFRLIYTTALQLVVDVGCFRWPTSGHFAGYVKVHSGRTHRTTSATNISTRDIFIELVRPWVHLRVFIFCACIPPSLVGWLSHAWASIAVINLKFMLRNGMATTDRDTYSRWGTINPRNYIRAFLAPIFEYIRKEYMHLLWLDEHLRARGGGDSSRG